MSGDFSGDGRPQGRRRPQRPDPEAGEQERRLGREHPKVRTTHGTRVARAITCVRCGEKDTLHFIPRHDTTALCRKCAAETLEVADRDASIFPPEADESPQDGPPPPSQRRSTGKGVIRVRRQQDER